MQTGYNSKMKSIRIQSQFRAKHRVTFYHGPCLEFLRTIPDASVQLVLTSPPYNVGKEYEENLTIEEYLKFQRQVIEESVRIVKPGGSICWQVGTHVNGHGQLIPLDILLHPLFTFYIKTDKICLRNRIVWFYRHGLHCDARFSGRHETILWYTKGDKYRFDLDAIRVEQKYPGKRAFKGKRKGEYSSNPLGMNPGDVWDLPNVKANHIEKTDHPCQFPLELPIRLILALTRRNDLVVDPYIGAGTTSAAAIKYGRRFAGAEIAGKYLRIARKRALQAASDQLPERPFGKPVHEPKPGGKLTTNPFKKRHQARNGGKR